MTNKTYYLFRTRKKNILSSNSNTSFDSWKSWYHDNGENCSPVCHGTEVKCACSFIIQITDSKSKWFCFILSEIERYKHIQFLLSVWWCVFIFALFRDLFFSFKIIRCLSVYHRIYSIPMNIYECILTLIISWNYVSYIRVEYRMPMKNESRLVKIVWMTNI